MWNSKGSRNSRVDEALAVDGMVGAIGIATAGGGGINPVRACLSSS